MYTYIYLMMLHLRQYSLLSEGCKRYGYYIQDLDGILSVLHEIV